MSILFNLRQASSGALIEGDNDLDTVVWDAAVRKWKVAPSSGGAVDSVFGRTGVVTAQSGDYDSDQIDNLSNAPGASVSDAFDSIVGTGAEIDDGPSGTAITIDLSLSPFHVLTLDDDCTITLTPPAFVRGWTLRVVMAAPGGFGITWPAGTRAPGGAITLTGATGTEDIISGYWNGTEHEITITNDLQAIP